MIADRILALAKELEEQAEQGGLSWQLKHSMSPIGTSRRFAAMQQYVGYRGHSGLWQAVRPAHLWVRGLAQ
jgi:hypothetical protein